MKFSYNWLKEYVRIKETPQKLAEALTRHSFEVQSIQKLDNDFILDIALPPNRVPDASGHMGMARETAAVLDSLYRMPKTKLKEDKKRRSRDILKISLQNASACRRYIGRAVQNITIADSPAWLQEKLIVCGLRPINNVVDATNYVMLETGQPLHVFDLDKMEGEEIIVRMARAGEMIKTLDNQDIILQKDDLVIADAKTPLALAGIKGGTKAEVGLKTKNIALEAANFDGSTIRKTSKRTGIKTDSSYRFEHNLHPELSVFAMERLVSLIQSLAGGTVLKNPIDVYPKEMKTREVFFDPVYGNKLIGTELSSKIYGGVFKRLGISFKKKKGRYLLSSPHFRTDLTIPEDYIEEVIRIYGYDKVTESHPIEPRVPAEKNDSVQWERFFRRQCQSFGFTEIYRYAFMGEKDIHSLQYPSKNFVELENPISSDFQYMVREPYQSFFSFVRQELKTLGIVKAYSLDKGFSRIQESGGDGNGTYREEGYLTMVLGERSGTGKDALYTIKGYIGDLLESSGIDDAWFDDVREDHAVYPHLQLLKKLHPYRRAEIKIGDETIGVFGELHPHTVRAQKIEGRVFVAEFLMGWLIKNADAEIEFRDIPRFPAIDRDVAVLVSEETRIEEVQGTIENAGGPLLEDVDFFDEYMGEGVPDGMRSLAFRLVFRDPKRTLEEKEVEAVMKKILAILQEKNWEVR